MKRVIINAARGTQLISPKIAAKQQNFDKRPRVTNLGDALKGEQGVYACWRDVKVPKYVDTANLIVRFHTTNLDADYVVPIIANAGDILYRELVQLYDEWIELINSTMPHVICIIDIHECADKKGAYYRYKYRARLMDPMSTQCTDDGFAYNETRIPKAELIGAHRAIAEAVGFLKQLSSTARKKSNMSNPQPGVPSDTLFDTLSDELPEDGDFYEVIDDAVDDAYRSIEDKVAEYWPDSEFNMQHNGQGDIWYDELWFTFPDGEEFWFEVSVDNASDWGESGGAQAIAQNVWSMFMSNNGLVSRLSNK